METPLFFKNNSYNLFGVLHEPDEAPSPRHPAPCPRGIVFCHPFAEEKLISHRVMTNLARYFMNQGMYCLRFDCMGHGDSDGSFEDATVETRLSDIRSAVEFLKTRTNIERVGLLGVRFGATLASLINANDHGLTFLILISPIIDGKAYIENCLRSNLTTQMSTHKKILKDRTALITDLMNGQKVNIDGYLLNQTLFQQISDISLLEASLVPPQNVLVVQLSRKDNHPIDGTIAALAARFEDLAGETEVLNVRGDYFWTDTKQYIPRLSTIETTISNWFEQTVFCQSSV